MLNQGLALPISGTVLSPLVLLYLAVHSQTVLNALVYALAVSGCCTHSAALLVALALLGAAEPFGLHLVDECLNVLLVFSLLQSLDGLLIVAHLRLHAVYLFDNLHIHVLKSLDAFIQWRFHSSVLWG